MWYINYFFGQIKMEYLGFWVTHIDYRSIDKRIEAIKNMTPPTTQKVSCKFIGFSELISWYMSKVLSHVTIFN